MRTTCTVSSSVLAGCRGHFRLLLAGLCLAGLLSTAQSVIAQEPIAEDDLRLVALTHTEVSLSFTSLLLNDSVFGQTATIELERLPLHGSLVEEPDEPAGFTYVPDQTFWAVGSDQLTYRLETPGGTAYATVHLAARRFHLGPFNAISFDDPTETTLLQRPGLSFETDSPIKGAGSLAVRATETGGTSYFSAAFSAELQGEGDNVEPVATDNGNTDFCLGGLPDPDTSGYLGFSLLGPAGYLVLIGPMQADLETAVVRVGLDPNFAGLYLEVKAVDADGTETWHRTESLARGSDTLRIEVSFDVEGTELAALLRFDGLALRSPVVPFYGPHPKASHLGFFLPPSGGTPLDLEIDRVIVAIEDEAPGQGPGLIGSLLMADGLQADGSTAWAATYGSGLQASSAPLTGASGFELTDIAAPSFSSYQVPSEVDNEQISLRTRIDTSALSIEEGRRLAVVNIQSHEHPLYGGPDHEIRLTEINDETIASLRFHVGNNVWRGMSWTPLDGEHVIRLQVGRSDGPRISNGWARLWVDGEIEQELFHLPNFHLPPRTVHLGTKHFLANMVSGAIRFDEVTVTK